MVIRVSGYKFIAMSIGVLRCVCMTSVGGGAGVLWRNSITSRLRNYQR